MAKSKEKVELDEFHYHEAGDRCNSINIMIEELLTKHPVIMQTPALKKLVDGASLMIGEIQQQVGQIEFDKEIALSLKKGKK